MRVEVRGQNVFRLSTPSMCEDYHRPQRLLSLVLAVQRLTERLIYMAEYSFRI